MRPIYATITGSGVTPPLVVDYIQAPFTIGAYVILSGSSVATYSIQVSPDEPQSNWATSYSANGNWLTWNQSTNLVNASTTQYNAITTPCRAVRMTVSGSSTTNTQIILIQGLAGNP